MIAGERDPQRALDIFNYAAERQRGFSHNNATYAAVLNRLAAARRFPAVDALLHRMRLEPCRFEEGPLLNLMRHFSAAGMPERALELLHSIPALVRRPRPSTRAVAACLDLLLAASRPDLASELLAAARRNYGISPNACLCNIVVKHHCRSGELPSAFRVLAQMRASKIKEQDHSVGASSAAPNRVTFTTLMGALCREGRLKAAFELFEEMIAVDGVLPDQLTFNVLIDGFCRSGEVDRAAHILAFMRRHGCDPNAVNFSTLMNGLCKAGRIEDAMAVFSDMKKTYPAAPPDAVAYTTLISCLCKNQRVDEALALAREMNQGGGCGPDVVAANVLIGGLCREGRTREAAALMEDLAGSGVKLNRASYRILMNRLCDDGDMDRAAALLGLMLARGVHPHFATSNGLLVKLCDAGRMAEAAAALRSLAAAGFAPETGAWLRLVESFCRERKLPRSLDLVDRLTSTAGVAQGGLLLPAAAIDDLPK